MWQTDFTHWTCADGTEVQVIGWLEDHSRFLLHLSAHHRVTGKTVTDTFTHTATEHGYPTSTLTDNGNVYTTRYARGGQGRGGRNAFEIFLALEGIIQKSGRPTGPPPRARSNASGRP